MKWRDVRECTKHVAKNPNFLNSILLSTCLHFNLETLLLWMVLGISDFTVNCLCGNGTLVSCKFTVGDFLVGGYVSHKSPTLKHLIIMSSGFFVFYYYINNNNTIQFIAFLAPFCCRRLWHSDSSSSPSCSTCAI